MPLSSGKIVAGGLPKTYLPRYMETNPDKKLFTTMITTSRIAM